MGLVDGIYNIGAVVLRAMSYNVRTKDNIVKRRRGVCLMVYIV